jgi:hypothetical protein
MTLFAPDDLPLDDLLKLENRSREISASQSRRAEVLAGIGSTDDAVKAVAPEAVESTNGASERLLSELEEFAARSTKAEPPSQSLASRLLSKLRPDR